MSDKDTDEELTFTCRRWLARDEDDFEICRELPAVRKGEPILPGCRSRVPGLWQNWTNAVRNVFTFVFWFTVVRYSVHVTTGNLWGASTEANVYMTMYGDRGDTGVRQLYSPSKGCFQQGKVGPSRLVSKIYYVIVLSWAELILHDCYICTSVIILPVISLWMYHLIFKLQSISAELCTSTVNKLCLFVFRLTPLLWRLCP